MSAEWARGITRWGQINLVERDVATIPIDWWTEVWERLHLEGITLNAGGIVAYYPTEIPHHRQSTRFGRRDLFGELTAAAKQRGMRVVARVDPARADRTLLEAHPDWFSVDREGRPHTIPGADDLVYQPCINGPHYWDFTAEILREVASRYEIDGGVGNRWGGSAGGICYCPSCQRLFGEEVGDALPDAADWEDPRFRRWLKWKQERQAALWAHYDRTLKSVRPDATWVGFFTGALDVGPLGIPNARRIGDLAEMLFVPIQRRRHAVMRSGGSHREAPLWHPAELGKILESGAPGKPRFGLFDTYEADGLQWYYVSRSHVEQTLWVAEALAAGLLPNFHCVSGTHEDRRFVDTLDGIYDHVARHSDLYQERRSIADVALYASPTTTEMYGRSDRRKVVEHFRGWYYALLRDGIAFDVLHGHALDRTPLDRYRAVVLPNAASLSEEECAWLRDFAAAGGGLIATHESGRYDEWGEGRDSWPLADLLGVDAVGPPQDLGGDDWMSMLRLEEPHAALGELAGRPLLPMGGSYCLARARQGTAVPGTLVPPFQWYPVESGWMPAERSDTGLVFARDDGDSRAVYLASDLDRQFFVHQIPDHGRLLAAAVRWAAGSVAAQVRGSGLVDIQAYRQESPSRLVVHLVNLTTVNLWQAPAEEVVPVGAQEVELRLPAGTRASAARLVRDEADCGFEERDGRVIVTVPGLREFDLLVVDLLSGTG